MRKEIDVLLQAARKNCAVVEKATNMLWCREDLEEAHATGRYQEISQLLPPDGRFVVNTLYPGCMQGAGARAETQRYCPVGQTEHFVIFALPFEQHSPDVSASVKPSSSNSQESEDTAPAPH